MQALHPSRGVRRAAIATMLPVLLGSALAQEVKPNPPVTRATPDEDAIVLSPFVIDASKDVGYRANNTLAGTRISTDLRDVAAPISVVTKDFMNDIGATDINDILAYQAGSEGTRDYTASTTSLGRSTDDVASNPNGATRGRGLRPYDITRDYFFSIGNAGFDSYNLDSVTISRGPNSVLAGLGSPSGIINYSAQTAQTGRNFNEVSYRIGSYGDHRATFNSNYVLLKNKLAVRVAGVGENTGFKQEPSYNHDRRLFLTTTWQATSKTNTRASYEWVQVKSNRPNSLTAEDEVTSWLAAGKPSHSAGQAIGAPFSGGLGGYTGPAVLFNADGSVSSAYNTTGQASFYQPTPGGLWQANRFRDNTYGDWQSVNTNPSTNKNTNKTFNLSVDQEILKNLNLNVAYVHEEAESEGVSLYRPDYVAYHVDVNTTLPWGAPNPHYGETFMYFRGLDNYQQTDNENNAGRVTLTYNLDLNKYNKWLGRYSLVGFAEKRETDYSFAQYNSVTPDGTESYRIYYLGGTAANGYKAQSSPRTPMLASGIASFNADGTPSTMTDSYLQKSASDSTTKLDTKAAVFQGYLWGDRIVPMIGVRRDVNRAGSAKVDGVGAVPGITRFDRVAATTTTYGVVVHPVKWIDLYYNKSENFVPNAGTVDLLGNTVSSPAGESKDYGVSVSLFDNKLSAKLGWYETKAASSPSAIANFPLAAWVIPFMEQGYPGFNGGVGPFQDLANKAGVVYKRAMAADLKTGDDRLANAYTSDQVAKGMELEVTYNVNKNWRIFFAASKQKAVETNIASALDAYLEERVAYWKSVPGLWTGQTTNMHWFDSNYYTGEQLFNNFIYTEQIKYKSADNKPSPQIAKWRASLVSNYSFTEGPLKGFGVGTGLRYIDGSIIGHPVIRDASGTIVSLDLDNPYKTGAYISADAWLSYTRRLSEKYVLTLTLRGQDLQSSGDYVAIYANPDGSRPVYRIRQPRSFYLTAKLDF